MIVGRQARQNVKTRYLRLITEHESRRGIEPLRRANRRQPPRSVQFLSPFPAAYCRSRRRSMKLEPSDMPKKIGLRSKGFSTV